MTISHTFILKGNRSLIIINIIIQKLLNQWLFIVSVYVKNYAALITQHFIYVNALFKFHIIFYMT